MHCGWEFKPAWLDAVSVVLVKKKKKIKPTHPETDLALGLPIISPKEALPTFA